MKYRIRERKRLSGRMTDKQIESDEIPLSKEETDAIKNYFKEERT